MCVSDTGVSPNMGDQYWPIRIVVRPFVRSTNANRMRICGCSSPNGGALVNVPKKSDSSVALGAHLPSTGPALKVKLMRVLRTSPSRSEEHTSELQSPCNLVCRLLLEKKKKKNKPPHQRTQYPR